MVPHIKIEDVLHDLAETTQRVFAVTGIPDDRKGERLVVLHTVDDERLAAVLERLPSAGLPNLWIPRRDAFHRVEAIPVLGTGKTDFRKVREVAMKLEQ
jgi:acyl-[acyl-carrier-protein]-phospholipid O-acyltransferase/long-chain-fatty-acid--[acyl-carrier-protein] ligase